ncbi:thymidine kinase [candidate division SR1 bacterium]|nr:thymidine kinase [candidate division SR1 bacterium]
MAKLYFRYGAMGSGKTAQLLMVAFNYQEKGQRAVIIKPALDIKGENRVSTRIGLEKDVDVLAGEEDDIFQIIQSFFPLLNCVLVDEAQFLSARQIDQLQQVVIQLNLPVIAYGLRCDGNQESRSGSCRLLEIADKIEELKTMCECGNKATMNCRFDREGSLILGGEKILIDGMSDVVYRSLCPRCWMSYKEKLSDE